MPHSQQAPAVENVSSMTPKIFLKKNKIKKKKSNIDSIQQQNRQENYKEEILSITNQRK
jgi:hypothetical protein